MKNLLNLIPFKFKGITLLFSLAFLSQFATAQKVQVLDNCDVLGEGSNAWKGTAIGISTDKKEGKGSVENVTNAINPFTRIYENPFDTGVTQENGYIAFSLFIENTDLLKGTGAIQFSSSGNASENSFTIFVGDLKINKVKLVNVWNNVVVPLSTITKINGAPDLTKINYFRLILYNKVESGPAQTYKLDNIRFSSNPSLLTVAN